MTQDPARWAQDPARWARADASPLPAQGDGLEFKRHFLKIKGKLSDIVSTQKVWLPPT